MEDFVNYLKEKLKMFGRGDDFWNPGATSEQIDALRSERVRMAPDFIELYSVCNGTNYWWSGHETKGSNLFPFLKWRPLPDTLAGGFAFFTDSWSKELICVTEDGITSRVICDAEDANVFSVSGQVEPYPLVYNSLESMLKTIVDCYKEGVYGVDEKGLITLFSKKEERQIAIVHNPGVLYWEQGYCKFF